MESDAKGGIDKAVAAAGADFVKFSGWPELKEAFMTGRIQAAYMLAPMVMDLANAGIPAKIVSLGHRSGAVIMVRTDSPAKTFRDLRGKRVAIPSRFAVDYLFVRKLMKTFGMTDKDLELVEMNPPDMPAALYARSVDAYATGEPFGAVAEKAGYARPLYMTRNEWPNYICCVLTVRDELIKTDRSRVQRLVNYVLSARQWLDASPANRTRAVEIAARPAFFNQDPEILKFVMQNPPDRVTYGDLKLIRKEFEELVQLSLEAGIIKRSIPYEKYVDDSFVRNAKSVKIASGPSSPSYEGRGSIVSMDKKGMKMTLQHEEIKGLMPAMTMEFRVKSRQVFDGVQPGHRVVFTLSPEGEELVVQKIVKGKNSH